MNLLTIEKPLVINPKLAERIGLNEAIVLQQLSYWISNTNSGVEENGYKWVYNTYKDWRKQMPFFSERTIQRAVLNLEEKGIVLSDTLNKSRGDRTKFYAIDYNHEALNEGDPNAKMALPSCQNGTTPDSAKMALPSCQNGTLSTETSTENTSQITLDTCANRTKSEFIESELRKKIRISSKKNPNKLEKKSDVLDNQISNTNASKNLDYSSWPELPEKQILEDWLDLRKQMKTKVSQTVINRFSKELHKAVLLGYSVDRCLTEVVTRGWRGFEAQWMVNNDMRNQANHPNQPFESGAGGFIGKHTDRSWAG